MNLYALQLIYAAKGEEFLHELGFDMVFRINLVDRIHVSKGGAPLSQLES